MSTVVAVQTRGQAIDTRWARIVSLSALLLMTKKNIRIKERKLFALKRTVANTFIKKVRLIFDRDNLSKY